MPYLFDHLDSIEQLLRLSPLGLITDVDGTISEIAPSPGEARVSPVCRQCLATLAQRLELVAVISGRPVEEVRQMVGIDRLVYIGNHGLEMWVDGVTESGPEAQTYSAKLRKALRELSHLLTIEGVAFDNKGPTASIHYRRCPEQQAARKAILSALERSPTARQFRLIEGRMAVDLRPPVETNKGSALLALIKRHRLRAAVYLGDDITDVDAFIALHSRAQDPPLLGLAIGIISEEASHQVRDKADYTLNGVADVEHLLRWLVDATESPDSSGPQIAGTTRR